ncbi:MAG: hypothetical protein R6X34_03695 [Chloroflexota bacterium]
MTVFGLIIILGVFISYLAMLFVLHRFTYKTWIFDFAVVTGMIIGTTSWIQTGGQLAFMEHNRPGRYLVSCVEN